MKPIVLFGIKHAGKSSLGSYLSKEMGLTWIDSDNHLASIARKEALSKTSEKQVVKKLQYLREPDSLSDIEIIRTIIAHQGESEFRRRELATVEEVFSEDNKNFILSTGGGICDNHPAMEIVKAQGWTLYLAVPEGILFQRIIRGGFPTWMDKSDPQGSFHELYKRRDAYYRSVAHLVLELEDRSLEETKILAIEQIKEQY